jgi:hypothetical protein
MKPVESLSDEAKQTRVGDAWAVVHSSRVALFYIEQLADAVTKSFRSFAAAAGEDWQIIGIFSSLREAHEAVTTWIRRPGAKRAREEAIRS